jgi:2-dehydro-3-deoxy-D-arabinonate dehydratase
MGQPDILSVIPGTGLHLLRIDGQLYVKRDGVLSALGSEVSLDQLLRLPLRELRESLSRARPSEAIVGGTIDAPIQSQEVWAAGVTYQRSREARAEESVDADPYDRVYSAARPELFFKATPNRVRGPGQKVTIRADSTWDVPEPELAVVCNSRGEIVGYTIGNDMSSRSIEGENPLYLPQAKVYDGCCALGPAIALAWEFDPADKKIGLEIRRDGAVLFQSETGTAAMRRPIVELIEYLHRHQQFISGCILLTGTGIVPPREFTLVPGDEVVIRIEGIGVLNNEVERFESG